MLGKVERGRVLAALKRRRWRRWAACRGVSGRCGGKEAEVLRGRVGHARVPSQGEEGPAFTRGE